MNAPNTTETPGKKKWPWFVKVALWGVPIILIAIIAGLLYLRVWLNNYLNSDAFRTMVAQLTAAQLNAKCDFAPFHFSGLKVRTDYFKAQGTAKAPFSTLEIDNIRTGIDLGGLRNHSLQIDDVNIDRIVVSLGHTGAPPVPESELGIPPPQPKSSSPSHFAWLTPKLDLRKVVVHETDVIWGEKTPQTGSVKGTKVTVTPEGTAWNALLESGTISQKGGPDMLLDHIKVHYADPLVSIPEGLLKFPPGGDISLNGEVNLQSKLEAHININGIPLKPFLPPDSQNKIKGKVFATVKVSGSMPVSAELVVSGEGRLDDADLEGFPVLDFLAKFTRSPQYRKIKLQQAAAKFLYEGEKVTISDLVIESRGLVSVTGGCVINNSHINGTFQIGVPHSFMMWLPILEAKVFTGDHGGYRWATMHLTGPVSSPKEDLASRIEQALLSAPLDTVKDVVKDLPKAPESTKKVIDGLIKPFSK